MGTDHVASPRKRRNKRDFRGIALVLIILSTLVLGYLIGMLPGRGVLAERGDKIPAKQHGQVGFSELQFAEKPAGDAAEFVPEMEPVTVDPNADPRAEEINGILRQAHEKIEAERFDEAIALLHGEREKIQQAPEAYLAMGQALAGNGRYEDARDFFNAAADRNPYLAEAYYGYARVSESLGDLESALGAMRSFLHVQPDADPQKLKIVQARSAIWEWESQLGRGPWGPTKGIPPGLTAEQVKRDGRGMAGLMPIPGTEEDGRAQFEIKHLEKNQIFKP